jgi:hypothetical protein
MTITFQTDLTDTSYNGWTNYETWNVALWIDNGKGLYNLARQCGDYQTFCDCMGSDAVTGDGISYTDPKVNAVEINSLVFDF